MSVYIPHAEEKLKRKQTLFLSKDEALMVFIRPGHENEAICLLIDCLDHMLLHQVTLKTEALEIIKLHS